jgi:isopenicillin N synthase-like dioxygenase
VNHGVAEEVIERMKAALEEFFKLPLEEKQKVAQPPNTLEGYGQAFVVSDDQKLDWADMLFLVSLPARTRNMKLWPVEPPNFRYKVLQQYLIQNLNTKIKDIII